MTLPALPLLSRLPPRVVGPLIAGVTVLIWTAFVVIARASTAPEHGARLTPADMVYLRLWGAAAVLFPLGWWLNRNSPGSGSLGGLSPLPLGITLKAGLFGGLLYALAAYHAFQFAPASHGAVLMPGSLPLWTSVLAVWLLGERLHRLRLVALGLIVAGDLLVGGGSLLAAFDGSGVWRGDLLFVTASLCWSVYSVLVRRHGLDAVRATVAITVFSFWAFVPAYTLALAAGWVPGQVLSVPWSLALFQMAFQGVGSVAISGITFALMIQIYGPVRSTMITALVPGLSALAAVVWLREPLHWNLLTGLLLVSLGIVVGVQKPLAPRAA